MASPAGGHPLPTTGQPPQVSPTNPNTNTLQPKPLDYSNILKPVAMNSPACANPSSSSRVDPIPLRRAIVVNGQPLVKFSEVEVERMNIIEGLQYVVIYNFSYGWPELQELCRIIPAQCGIKGECNVGFLRDKHVLFRLPL